ncbi:MAG: hypothetical protein KAT90_12145 [Gammaproteobacteria bacterium]|nr:hypothetical protein [Gammaproteobacteria bacterium]
MSDKYDEEEVLIMISDCKKRDEKMSSWECDFIESIEDRATSGIQLTENQLEKLNTIWEKIT